MENIAVINKLMNLPIGDSENIAGIKYIRVPGGWVFQLLDSSGYLVFVPEPPRPAVTVRPARDLEDIEVIGAEVLSGFWNLGDQETPPDFKYQADKLSGGDKAGQYDGVLPTKNGLLFVKGKIIDQAQKAAEIEVSPENWIDLIREASPYQIDDRIVLPMSRKTWEELSLEDGQILVVTHKGEALISQIDQSNEDALNPDQILVYLYFLHLQTRKI